jgi:hypothetical protein
VSFAKACFVFTVDKRDMGKMGYGIVQRFIYKNLTRGIVDMVITPDNVGNPHECVVDYDREIISGSVVGPEDNKIIQFFVIKCNLSSHEVIETHFSTNRVLESYYKGPALIASVIRQISACSIVGRFLSLFEGRLSLFFQYFGATVTFIRIALLQQPVSVFPVNLYPFFLKKGALIPADPKPGEPL